MTQRSLLAAAVAVAVHVSATPARASDPVMEWNQIALAATVTAGQGPVPQVRSMAIVQTSVHDAVNTITGTYATYVATGPAPAGASADAAAIAAAHYVLTRLFPVQIAALDSARTTSLAAHGVTESDPGIAVGEAAAAAILALRAADGAAQAQFPYVAPGAGMPGVWIPLGTAAPATPGWGNVTPWVLRTGSQFRPDGPPTLGSERYARDYNEVRIMGALNNSGRTPEQTEIARFWLGSPAAIWNSVARGVITARNLDQASTARLFGLMYLAGGDASIACWDAKYTYNFWRPRTAIVNADVDDNPATIPDTAWTSAFTPVPQHPEYPSGHSCNSGAMGTVLALLLGDDPGVRIVASSPTNAGFPREWTRFSEGVDEVVDARIYSGFHFRTSDEVGARLGRQVARFVMTHALRQAHP